LTDGLGPPTATVSPSDAPGSGPKDDLTGRTRLVRNVLFSWGAILATGVVAFVHPRVMDRCLGQDAVGIWDFGWSLVAYFGLAQFGVGSAITRYVAKHRASGDVLGLRRVVASVNCINGLAATVALVATAILTWLAPRMLSTGAASHALEAQFVVALVGATVASEIGFGVFSGVIGGCHRFDLNNSISVSFEVATWITAITALLLGGGLVAVASICLGFELATEAARIFFAYRVCPEMSIRIRYADLANARSLLRFGLKSQLGSLSGLMILQANKLFVGSFLGTQVLAVFTRPLTLLRVADTFANRMGFILSPTASSLQATGQMTEVRTLVEDSTRAGMALAVPTVLTLAVLGDPIMVVWMGPRYLPGVSLIILAAGMSLSLALGPVRSILLGLNLHGRLALAQFAGAVLSVGLGWLNVRHLGWGRTGASLAIAVPSFLIAVFVMAYVCRSVKLPVATYLRRSFLSPLLCAAPLLVVLLASRILLASSPFLSLLAGVSVGGLALLPLYWRFLLTSTMREKARRAVVRRLSAFRKAPLPRPAV
jgi:O-antigen/teichoic acid export membrane protein